MTYSRNRNKDFEAGSEGVFIVVVGRIGKVQILAGS